MVKPAEVLIEKQMRRAEGAQEDYKKGIENPERDPIESALAANDKRIANLMKSIENKTWEAVMGTLTKADWQRKALAVGPARFVQGVKANRDKIEKFQRGFNAMLQALQDEVRAMPDATEAEREARMIAMKRGMVALKGKWR